MLFPETDYFWLILHHYIHFDIGKNGILFYNTINNQSLIFDFNSPIIKYIKFISNSRNPIKINKYHVLKNEKLKSQLTLLRREFMADFIPIIKNNNKPPIQHILKANIQSDVSSIRLKNVGATGNQVLKYLTEITIYLTEQSILLGDEYPKAHEQFIWPITTHNSLFDNINYKKIINFLYDLEYSSVSIINLMGGNPFLYNQYDLLYDWIQRQKNCRILTHIYVDEWLTYHENIKNKKKYENIDVCICVTLPRLKKISFDSLIDSLKLLKNPEFSFLIEQETDMLAYEQLIKLVYSKKITNKENINFQLYFGDNKTELSKFLFDKTEILDSKPTMLDIMARKELNQLQFGKICINTTGDIFGGFNNKNNLLGKIGENNLGHIIYKELTEGASWMSTRKNFSPCSNCMYRSVCPPISAYEKISGKTMCNIDI